MNQSPCKRYIKRFLVLLLQLDLFSHTTLLFIQWGAIVMPSSIARLDRKKLWRILPSSSITFEERLLPSLSTWMPLHDHMIGMPSSMMDLLRPNDDASLLRESNCSWSNVVRYITYKDRSNTYEWGIVA